MGGNREVFLTALVFEADGIGEVEGLEALIRGLDGVSDELGFKPLAGRRPCISVMFALMRDSKRAKVAETVVEKVTQHLSEQGFGNKPVAIQYVYAMRFPNHLFTNEEVSTLRKVPHALVSRIIGFNGSDFLQVWLKEQVSADQALSTLRVIAAQTSVGFL